MKTIALLAIVAFSSAATMAAPRASSSPVLTDAPVERLYVPREFDETQAPEVVLHGNFPNGCYELGPTDSQIDETERKIVLSAKAYFHPGRICIQMLIPFTKAVQLKQSLPAGRYTVTVADQPGVEPAELFVQQPTTSEEKSIYASVKKATISRSDDGRTELILEGRHPFLFDGCVKMIDIRTTLRDDQVVDVEPLTTIAYDGQCASLASRNEFVEKIDLGLPRGDYLIHVRTLKGDSIDQIVSIE